MEISTIYARLFTCHPFHRQKYWSIIELFRKDRIIREHNDCLPSDQGFYMGEHGWFDKRFMYEESFRTPLLIRLPGGKKGDIGEFVQNIDYGRLS